MKVLVANEVGRHAAARFRRRFKLTPIDSSYEVYGVSGDAHDYLHTVMGNLPGVSEDENAVLFMEEDILKGRVPVPRGCELLDGGGHE